MGDSRRFQVFADFIAKHYSSKMRVADIAAGKGYLSLALKERGFDNVTAFDIRSRVVKGLRFFRRNFTVEDARDFDLLIGLHPDEATDVIIFAATKFGKKFAVVPCCEKTLVSKYWGGGWLKHLSKISSENGVEPKVCQLKMTGRNIVMWS